VAVGVGLYFLLRKKPEEASASGLEGATLALQTSPLPAPAAAGSKASLSDAGSLAWPDLSALPWADLLPSAVPQSGERLGYADRFGTAPLYQYDPWHPGSYVLSAEGVKVLSSPPLNGYLLDHDTVGVEAVFHSMSSPATSSARNDARPYNGSNTIRTTVEGGNAIFLSKKDLDDLQFGNVPSTLTFSATKDANAWLLSPNAALYNVRVRPSIEGLPAAYTTGETDAVATPYGAKLFNDAMPRGYVAQTIVNNPIDGATKYVVSAASSTAYKASGPIIAAALVRGLMVYASKRDMDSLAGNPASLAPDFYLVWPGTVMGKDYVRVS
jgi:hypothetical protein